MPGARFPYKLGLQGDRNAVFYDSLGNVLGATHTAGGPDLSVAPFQSSSPYYLLPG